MNKPIVIIGNGSSINKYIWNPDLCDIYVSNSHYKKYKGDFHHLVIAEEHGRAIRAKMPKEIKLNKDIIEIDHDYCRRKHRVIMKAGSLCAFIHATLQTNKRKIIVLQGVDFDDKSRNWERYKKALTWALEETKENKNIILTTSNKLVIEPYMTQIITEDDIYLNLLNEAFVLFYTQL